MNKWGKIQKSIIALVVAIFIVGPVFMYRPQKAYAIHTAMLSWVIPGLIVFDEDVGVVATLNKITGVGQEATDISLLDKTDKITDNSKSNSSFFVSDLSYDLKNQVDEINTAFMGKPDAYKTGAAFMVNQMKMPFFVQSSACGEPDANMLNAQWIHLQQSYCSITVNLHAYVFSLFLSTIRLLVDTSSSALPTIGGDYRDAMNGHYTSAPGTSWVMEDLDRQGLLGALEEFGYNSKMFAWLSGSSANHDLIDPIQTVLGNTDSNSVGNIVNTGYSMMLKFVNFFVILLFLIMALASILQIQVNTYSFKKLLPGIVLGIILANFSMFAIKALLEISDVLSTSFSEILDNGKAGGPLGFYNAFTNVPYGPVDLAAIDCIDNPANVTGAKTLADYYKNPLDLYSATTKFDQTKPSLRRNEQKGLHILANRCIYNEYANNTKVGDLLITTIFNGTATVCILIVAFLLFLRRFIFFFLAVFAPLAFFSMNVQPLSGLIWNRWWKTINGWIWMPIPVAFWIAMAQLWFTTVGGAGQSTVNMILAYIFGLMCFIFAIKTPFGMAGEANVALNKWGAMGKKAWGSTGGALGKATGKFAKSQVKAGAIYGGTKLADKVRLTGVVSNYKNWRKVRSEEYDQTIKQSWDKAPSRGTAKRREQLDVNKAKHEQTFEDAKIKAQTDESIQNQRAEIDAKKETSGILSELTKKEIEIKRNIIQASSNELHQAKLKQSITEEKISDSALKKEQGLYNKVGDEIIASKVRKTTKDEMVGKVFSTPTGEFTRNQHVKTQRVENILKAFESGKHDEARANLIDLRDSKSQSDKDLYAQIMNIDSMKKVMDGTASGAMGGLSTDEFTDVEKSFNVVQANNNGLGLQPGADGFLDLDQENFLDRYKLRINVNSQITAKGEQDVNQGVAGVRQAGLKKDRLQSFFEGNISKLENTKGQVNYGIDVADSLSAFNLMMRRGEMPSQKDYQMLVDGIEAAQGSTRIQNLLGQKSLDEFKTDLTTVMDSINNNVRSENILKLQKGYDLTQIGLDSTQTNAAFIYKT